MRRIIIVAAAVAALGLLALGAGAAVTAAQGEDGNPIDTFLGKVADKLGVSEDDLRTAIKDAQLEMIDEAVADDRLTEEQAEKLRERVDEYGFALPLRPDRHLRQGVCQRAGSFIVEAAAQALDMEKGQLQQELKDGKSLVELAQEQGMSEDEFKDALLGEIQSQLDEQVDQEKLTQEQADRLSQKAEENIDRIVDAHGRLGPGPCKPGRGPGPAPRGPFGPRAPFGPQGPSGPLP